MGASRNNDRNRYFIMVNLVGKMGKQITIDEVKFIEEYDREKVTLTADYRGLLGAKLTFRRPGAGYDMKMLFDFMESDEYTYIKMKLVKLIQIDLDKLNA